MANLAIVGAGVGGCSVAYFARKYLPGVNVTIYDAQDRIGGRILTHQTAGLNLELGAAFFNDFNKTLWGIVKAERLKVVPTRERENFGIWNGSEFVFRSSRRPLFTSVRLLAKYGVSLERAFLRLRMAKSQVAKLYRKLNNPVEMSEAFESAGLDFWSRRSLSEVLAESGVSKACIDEIVTPVTKAIYSQNADLGGFAGISSLIGVYSGRTYCLAEGNSTLPIHMVKTSNAAVKLGRKVEAIEKMANNTYRLYVGNDVTVFDSVIIATPLDFACIRFEGLSMDGWEPQPYQTIYRKVMRGIFDPSCFGLKSVVPPAVVLTTDDADPITQLGIREMGGGESLVTIISIKPIEDGAFGTVFKDCGVLVLEHNWKAAYPVFKPMAKLPPTRLDKRLIYCSAIDSAVSSMETSALSALNAVRILSGE